MSNVHTLIDIDEPYKKMKCYYLSKELNSCLGVMNAMLEFEDEEDEDQVGEDRVNYERLTVDRDCLDALRKSSQGSSMFIQQALNTFENVLHKHEYGDIFKKSDCIFFAGVMCFFLQDYGKAKNYFIDAKGEKLLLNQIANAELSASQQENRLFSLQEINYNIGICDFVQGKWSTYLDLYPEFKRQHGSIVTENLLDEQEQITPFQVKNRLCSIYSPHRLGNCSFRLSFCLPRIKLPEVKFNKNMNLIRSIKLSDIEMRPSAPWIQKSKRGIIFTTEVLKQSIDFKSEKSRKVSNRKKAQERYKEPEPV